MSDLIRYNVRSMYVDGPASWEFQAAENGQWLPADTTLDHIKALEEKLRVATEQCQRAATEGERWRNSFIDTLRGLRVHGVEFSVEFLLSLARSSDAHFYQVIHNREPGGEHRLTLVGWDPGGLQAADVQLIGHEVLRSNMHGKYFASLHEAYAVILEELDEIWDLTRMKKRDRDPAHLWKELTQLAAMAVKAMGSIRNFTGGDV